jgi:hypothetical protein
MFFSRQKRKQEYHFLISAQENTIDIVLKYPISIFGKNISEFTFELDYFYRWVQKNGMNIRFENRYDAISETTSHNARTISLFEYIELPPEQIRIHISKFINDYQKTQNYGKHED